MMLDMRRTFDEMVYTHSTADRAEKIIANPFYQTISSSFSGTQEYMAMEKLGQLIATGKWDSLWWTHHRPVPHWTSWTRRSGCRHSWTAR